MVDDKVGLAVEEPLPGSGDAPRNGDAAASPGCRRRRPEQGQRLRHGAEIADHHPQFAFLAHGELGGMAGECAPVMEEDPRAFVKRPPGLGQADAIPAAVE